MENNTKELYIDLLEKSLTGLIHYDTAPYSPLVGGPGKNPLKVLYTRFFYFLLKKGILVARRVPRKDFEEGRRWPIAGETMVGHKRLQNIRFCVEDVLKNNIAGDFIETGVWRGGSSIFMRALLKVHEDTTRKVFVADSFEGLPKPDKEYKEDTGDDHYKIDYLQVSLEQVKKNFQNYGMLDEQVVFLKGWFKDTLPTAPIEKLSILRLDGDMYQSTWEALTALYSKLQAGGYCIVDDYSLVGCRDAVHAFRSKHDITDEIIDIDGVGAYWKKTA
jgi:O-methyltransferase